MGNTTEGRNLTKEQTTKEAIVLKIPEMLAQELKRDAQQTLEAIRQEAPNLLIVLQRSGTQLFTSVEAQEGAREILPNKVDVPIGRHVYQKVLEEVIIPADGEDARWELEEYNIEKHEAQIATWIQEAPYPQRICTQLAQSFREMKPQKVMIIDDTASSGATEILAKMLVAEALRSANISDKDIPTRMITKDGDWRQKILHHSLGNLPPEETYFLGRVSRGTVEQQGELHNITSETHLKELGAESQRRFGGTENTYQQMKERYGTQTLLELGKNLEASLETL